MTNDQHTSLPLSKLIHERVPELETGMFWVYFERWGNKKGKMCRVEKGYRLERFGEVTDADNFPAPTFTDCLRAIQMLDKTGWADLYYRKRQRELLEHYLSDHLEIGENTERFLTSLFSK